MKITPEDRARIAAAIAEAESRTAGEIVCVVADTVADDWEIPLGWAAAAALVLPPAALFLGFRPEALSAVFGGWTVAHAASSDATVLSSLATYVVLQTLVFLAVLALVAVPAVRRQLTPGRRTDALVHRAAMEQFVHRGVHRTRGQTGVLIFAALAEHRAQVVADEGVYAQAPTEVWAQVADRLTEGLRRGSVGDGFAAAIARAGEILAEHAPPEADNPNERPDELIETSSRRRRKPPGD